MTIYDNHDKTRQNFSRPLFGIPFRPSAIVRAYSNPLPLANVYLRLPGRDSGAEQELSFSSSVFRDGPNTITTTIFQRSFASDVASKRHLMAHQMQNLCVFSVFHCVEGAFGAASGGAPKMKNGAPQDELKNGRGRRLDVFGSSLKCFGRSAIVRPP